MIINNVVIVGFSEEDFKLLAHVTVRLQESDYSQITANCLIKLSNDNFADLLEQNTTVYGTIAFEEIELLWLQLLAEMLTLHDDDDDDDDNDDDDDDGYNDNACVGVSGVVDDDDDDDGDNEDDDDDEYMSVMPYQ